VLDVLVARNADLLVDRDRVEVRGVRRERHERTGAPRLVDQLLDQEMCAIGTFRRQHAVERIQPLPRFLRVDVVLPVHRFLLANRRFYARGPEAY
jgi:hypothetical protein